MRCLVRLGLRPASGLSEDRFDEVDNLCALSDAVGGRPTGDSEDMGDLGTGVAFRCVVLIEPQNGEHDGAALHHTTFGDGRDALGSLPRRGKELTGRTPDLHFPQLAQDRGCSLRLFSDLCCHNQYVCGRSRLVTEGRERFGYGPNRSIKQSEVRSDARTAGRGRSREDHGGRRAVLKLLEEVTGRVPTHPYRTRW